MELINTVQQDTGPAKQPFGSDWVEEVRVNYDLARILKKQGYRTIALPSRGLPFRPGEFKCSLSYAHVAELAGMGTIGTHSLLISPEFGTRTRLTGLFTEAPLQTTKRIDPVDDCSHCLDCVKICPVGDISRRILPLRVEPDAQTFATMTGLPVMGGRTKVGTAIAHYGLYALALVDLDPWRKALQDGHALHCAEQTVLITWPTWLARESRGRGGPVAMADQPPGL